MKRFSVNITQEQAKILNQFAKYSKVSLNEAVRQFIGEASHNFVREITIWTKDVTKHIILKDKNVYYFKRFNDTGEQGDWIDVFEIGMTAREVVEKLIECKNCEYKQYIVSFDDMEIPVDDIIGCVIETIDGEIYAIR